MLGGRGCIVRNAIGKALRDTCYDQDNLSNMGRGTGIRTLLDQRKKVWLFQEGLALLQVDWLWSLGLRHGGDVAM